MKLNKKQNKTEQENWCTNWDWSSNGWRTARPIQVSPCCLPHQDKGAKRGLPSVLSIWKSQIKLTAKYVFFSYPEKCVFIDLEDHARIYNPEAPRSSPKAVASQLLAALQRFRPILCSPPLILHPSFLCSARSLAHSLQTPHPVCPHSLSLLSPPRNNSSWPPQGLNDAPLKAREFQSLR